MKTNWETKKDGNIEITTFAAITPNGVVINPEFQDAYNKVKKDALHKTSVNEPENDKGTAMNLTGEELTIDIGKCPCCGSEQIFRTDFDFDCDGGKEVWECGNDKCISEWEIVFNVEYVCHYVTGDDYNMGYNPNQDLED